VVPPAGLVCFGYHSSWDGCFPKSAAQGCRVKGCLGWHTFYTMQCTRARARTHTQTHTYTHTHASMHTPRLRWERPWLAKAVRMHQTLPPCLQLTRLPLTSIPYPAQSTHTGTVGLRSWCITVPSLNPYMNSALHGTVVAARGSAACSRLLSTALLAVGGCQRCARAHVRSRMANAKKQLFDSRSQCARILIKHTCMSGMWSPARLLLCR
jgi:hypothetical protein